jgi:hypothetical protein
VFENRVLRTILQAKRDEVTGEWRKLHSEELLNLYSSPDIVHIKSRRMKWVGTCGTHGRGVESVQDFVGKARRKETTSKTKA